MQQIYARQGDLVISASAKISGDLAPANDLVVAGGSSGHPHVIVGPCLHRREGTVTFVRVPKTSMTHGRPDGHVTVDLAAGDYEIYPLRESRDGLTDQDVVD